MKLALLSALALVGASSRAYAHELRGATIVLADIAASDEQAADGKPADLFPSEEETEAEDRRDRDLDDDYRGGRDRDFDDDRRPAGKESSAQKRQRQRDERRRRNNPGRTQREEDRERDRKYRQSRSRGDRSVDPYDPGHGSRDFSRDRERRRERDCDRNDRGCNFSRGDTREPNPRRRDADSDCFRGCRGSRSCERRCAALDDVEDVEYIADFLNHEDVAFVADFLWDAFDEDDLDAFYEDS